jgi:hypothetical protein
MTTKDSNKTIALNNLPSRRRKPRGIVRGLVNSFINHSERCLYYSWNYFFWWLYFGKWNQSQKIIIDKNNITIYFQPPS